MGNNKNIKTESSYKFLFIFCAILAIFLIGFFTFQGVRGYLIAKDNNLIMKTKAAIIENPKNIVGDVNNCIEKCSFKTPEEKDLIRKCLDSYNDSVEFNKKIHNNSKVSYEEMVKIHSELYDLAKKDEQITRACRRISHQSPNKISQLFEIIIAQNDKQIYSAYDTLESKEIIPEDKIIEVPEFQAGTYAIMNAVANISVTNPPYYIKPYEERYEQRILKFKEDHTKIVVIPNPRVPHNTVDELNDKINDLESQVDSLNQKIREQEDK